MAGVESNAFKAPDTVNAPEELPKETATKIDVDKNAKNVAKDKKEKLNVPLPYKEPEWSGMPTLGYSFEVIKNGASVGVVNIKAPITVFGRLELCEVVLEHPSASRYHAILQYCKGDESHPKGFYLYDLASTHGTFLNKEKVKPNIYYKLKVGYVIKFGGSSRLHIFQGPEEEEEEITKQPDAPKEESCSWGMGDDADEEEDLTENPFALSTNNEEMYIDDPKKTLKGWFEREGYDLEYHVEEKGFKNFLCRIQLPVDNPMGDFLNVEVTISGRKKEAVVACALEACRTLDRLGLLRQSHHESRERKKKKWEENDYYDSDEDVYLDRTGTIEKKREMRMKLQSKKQEVETFQTLEAKLNDVDQQIEEIKRKLDATATKHAMQSSGTEEDSLDSYMSNLSNDNKKIDKIERTKLKFRLADAEKQRKRLQQLMNIARPAKLPFGDKYAGMIGKRVKSKLRLPSTQTEDKTEKQENVESEEEEEEEEEKSDAEKPQKMEVNEPEIKSSPLPNPPKLPPSLYNSQKDSADENSLDAKNKLSDINQEELIEMNSSVETSNENSKEIVTGKKTLWASNDSK